MPRQIRPKPVASASHQSGRAIDMGAKPIGGARVPCPGAAAVVAPAAVLYASKLKGRTLTPRTAEASAPPPPSTGLEASPAQKGDGHPFPRQLPSSRSSRLCVNPTSFFLTRRREGREGIGPRKGDMYFSRKMSPPRKPTRHTGEGRYLGTRSLGAASRDPGLRRGDDPNNGPVSRPFKRGWQAPP